MTRRPTPKYALMVEDDHYRILAIAPLEDQEPVETWVRVGEPIADWDDAARVVADLNQEKDA